MTKFNLNDQMEQANKEYGTSSEWLSIEAGTRVTVRLLTPLLVVPQHYVNNKYELCVGKDVGCPFCKINSPLTTKWLGWVHDKADNMLKICSFSYTVAKQLRDLQNTPDYQFDEAPLPYDIIITRNDDSGKAVYSTIGARQNTPVDPSILEQLTKKNTPEQIKQSMKEKQLKKLGLAPKDATDKEFEKYPANENNPDGLPDSF